jgi:hypothetical protein
MEDVKIKFLKTELPRLLSQLKADAKGEWGVLNGQQMVEHLTEAICLASGEVRIAQVTPEERLPAFRDFLFSEKEFKPNTKTPLMPEQPVPARHSDMAAAIQELNEAVAYFFAHYKAHPEAIYLNPIFGKLTFEQQLVLLSKHARHHCRQFKLIQD